MFCIGRQTPRSLRQMAHGPVIKSWRQVETIHLGGNSPEEKGLYDLALVVELTQGEKLKAICTLRSNKTSCTLTKRGSTISFGRPVPVWGSKKGVLLLPLLPSLQVLNRPDLHHRYLVRWNKEGEKRKSPAMLQGSHQLSDKKGNTNRACKSFSQLLPDLQDSKSQV